MRFFTGLIVILFITLVSGLRASALQDSTNTKNDSTDIFSDFENWDNRTTDSLAIVTHTPTIEMEWGMTRPSLHNNVFKNSKFTDIGDLEIRLGFISKSLTQESRDIIDYSFKYLYLGKMSKGFYSAGSNTGNTESIETDIWRFGYAGSSGYGYRLSDDNSMDLIFYHTSGIGWTKIGFKDTSAIPENQATMNSYGDVLRFGTNFEGGIRFQISPLVSIHAGYERAIVFPRHIFWYWVASEITEDIGQGIVSLFTDQVLSHSPKAAPVVYFLLKNAVSYGFYELRRKHMNWPVLTTSPFMMENFKAGVSVSF